MTVPSIAVGTISWTKNAKNELTEVVQKSMDSGLYLFDTAERYGASGAEVAVGLGWGACESELGRYIREAAQETTTRQYASRSQAPSRRRVFGNRETHGTHSPGGGDLVAPGSVQLSSGGRSDHIAPPGVGVMATKFTPSPWRTTAASVVKACEDSRQRLGVDSIDLYQIHMPDIVHPLAKLGFEADRKDEVYWEGLAECYHRGLIKNCGVSNYGPTLLARCHDFLAARGVPLASNQINYSLLYRAGGIGHGGGGSEAPGARRGGEHQGRVGSQAAVDVGAELGVKTLAYFPLAMGLLTGKYHAAAAAAAPPRLPGRADQKGRGLRVANKRSALEERELRSYVDATAPLVRVMEEVGQRYGVGATQVALNWVTCKGAIPVVGCRTLAHVEGARQAMGWALDDGEVARLEQAADDTGVTFEGAGFKRSGEKFVGYGVESWRLD